MKCYRSIEYQNFLGLHCSLKGLQGKVMSSKLYTPQISQSECPSGFFPQAIKEIVSSGGNRGSSHVP